MTRWMALGAVTVVCGYAALAHAQTVATPTPAATPVTGTTTQDNRMVLAENESFLVPLEDLKNAHPSYPPNLLGLNLPPRTVCLLVAIDEKGAVILVAKAPTSDNCPKGAEPEFRAAAETAAKTWNFEPALRCVFRNAEDKKRAVSSCYGGKEIPQAVTLVYRFQFEQVNGTPQVRVSQ